MAVHDWKEYEYLWQTFHDRLIHAMANIMVDEDLLPEGFSATPTGKIYVNRQIEPDMVLTKSPVVPPPEMSDAQTAFPSTLDFVAKRPAISTDKQLMISNRWGLPVAVMELISPKNRLRRSYYAVQYEEYIVHGLTFVMIDLIYFVGANVHDITVEKWENALPIPDHPEKKLFIAIYVPETEEITRVKIHQFGFREDFPEVVLNLEGYVVALPFSQAYGETARRMKLPPA
ncbi:MAG: hypothetical protein O7E52_25540 [Candidatus Poribacteria bacterium]|nr:hypothetical protein [Candidatus Poribacteria bacterium]